VLLEVALRLMGLPAQHLRTEIKTNIDRMLLAAKEERALQKLRWLHGYSEHVSGENPSEARIQELVLKVRASSANS